jgi:ABC-type branched-subunit amino acid transport system substrate-binding protein
MVKEYIAKYGGTASEVNADVAEAYSVGQVITQAVEATHGFNNAKIIAYLHSAVTMTSVQGPVKFNAAGENTALAATTFQWQNAVVNPVIPVGAPGTKKPLYPKPPWSS